MYASCSILAYLVSPNDHVCMTPSAYFSFFSSETATGLLLPTYGIDFPAVCCVYKRLVMCFSLMQEVRICWCIVWIFCVAWKILCAVFLRCIAAVKYARTLAHAAITERSFVLQRRSGIKTPVF